MREKRVPNNELEAMERAVGEVFDEGTDTLDRIFGQETSDDDAFLDMSAASSGSSGRSGGGGRASVLTDSAKDDLDVKYCTLGRSIKLAEKVRDQLLATRPGGDRFARAMDQLCDTLENAELCHMSVGFSLKFKKMQDGAALTTKLAEELADKLDNFTTGLLTDVKAVKVHLPPTKK